MKKLFYLPPSVDILGTCEDVWSGSKIEDYELILDKTYKTVFARQSIHKREFIEIVKYKIIVANSIFQIERFPHIPNIICYLNLSLYLLKPQFYSAGY